MEDINPLRIVSLTYQHGQNRGHSDTNLWIAMLEQLLACYYTNYNVSIIHDAYEKNTNVSITFENVEDATFFKLQHIN